MAQLVDSRGYNLNPRLGGFGKGIVPLAQLQQFGQQNIAQGKREQIKSILAQQQGQPTGTPEQPQFQTDPATGQVIPQPEAPQVMTLAQKKDLARQIDPIEAENIFKQTGIDSASQRAEASRFASQLETTPFAQRSWLINARIQKLQGEGRDAKDTIELLQMDEQTQNQAALGIQLADLSTKERLDYKGKQRASGQRIGTYNPRDYTVESFAEFRKTGDPAALERYTEKTINVGGVQYALDPATNTYKETVTVEKVASNKAKIAAAVKQAESSARSAGEEFSAYNRAKAALPGLIEVTDKLHKLADVATYTTTGKVFNVMAKELGFGATKGATARASMTSLVDNQILPLLRETFGAAFTAEEGNRLRATILNIDSTPEERKATLESFIDQKIRNLQTTERQRGSKDLTTEEAVRGQMKDQQPPQTVGRFKVEVE